MRKFETGATRDTNDGKLEYRRFTSPLVRLRFAQYMHKHRVQPDGSVRAADNWKKGMPKEVYLDSGYRHMEELDQLLFFDPRHPEAEEKICAILFNMQGLLHEMLVEQFSLKWTLHSALTTEPEHNHHYPNPED